MKTYKHKKLGWIAKKRKDTDYYELMGDGTEYLIVGTSSKRFRCYLPPKEFIENSLDRELQEEKDWIDEVIEEIDMDGIINRGDVGKTILRKAIEKHMPKITEEEMKEIDESYGYQSTTCPLFKLIKQKWLYKE